MCWGFIDSPAAPSIVYTAALQHPEVHMERAVIELRALRLLCDILQKQLKELSPNHPLLTYQDQTKSPAERERLLRKFYIEYGPMSMNRDTPSPEHKVECFMKYRLALIVAVTIEKARHWGDLPKI
jgi:hypothetical protein